MGKIDNFLKKDSENKKQLDQYLFAASKAGAIDAVKVFLEAGADVKATELAKRTALHASSANGHMSASRMLLKANADPYAVDWDGLTPAHLAAEKGHKSIIKLFINEKLDLNFEGKCGYTPFLIASANGHAGVCKMLIDAQVDIHSTVKDKKLSALHLAAANGHDGVVDLLLKAGLDAKALDSEGYSPLDWAKFNGHGKIVKKLQALESDSRVVSNDELKSRLIQMKESKVR